MIKNVNDQTTLQNSTAKLEHPKSRYLKPDQRQAPKLQPYDSNAARTCSGQIDRTRTHALSTFCIQRTCVDYRRFSLSQPKLPEKSLPDNYDYDSRLQPPTSTPFDRPGLLWTGAEMNSSWGLSRIEKNTHPDSDHGRNVQSNPERFSWEERHDGADSFAGRGDSEARAILRPVTTQQQRSYGTGCIQHDRSN